MNSTGSRTQLKGIIILLLIALIWGSAFVAQSVGMESVECFTFSGIRTLLGALVLLPFILIREKKQRKNSTVKKPIFNKKTIVSGSILGVVLFLAANFQQYAFNYSTPGKIAFITALYMFFVPLFGLFLKKKVSKITWLCVVMGFVGLFCLCLNPSELTAINTGDILAFICAIFFAIQILLVDKFAQDIDGIKLSFIQFLVSGLIALVLMFILENPQLPAIRSALIPILYSGILSCGVAYTFQIIGQKYCEPTIASLLMCMESVFAVLASAIILHDILSFREAIGCIIMFAAILISQFSEIIAVRKHKPVQK